MHKHYLYQILAVGYLLVSYTSADVVWSGEQNFSGNEQNIDLNLDSRTDVFLAYEIGTSDIFPPMGTSAVLRAYIDGFPVSGSNKILMDASSAYGAALPYGTLVSGTPDSSLEWKGGMFAAGNVGGWSTSSPEPDTEWNGMLGETGEAYLGIAFDIDNSTHYGWVHVTLGENNPEYGFEDPITASWAYESTPNTPIAAGVIPEPSTGILTMVGSLSLLFLARSRRRPTPRKW